MNWKTSSRDAWRKRVGLDRDYQFHVYDSGGILFFGHSAGQARRKEKARIQALSQSDIAAVQQVEGE